MTKQTAPPYVDAGRTDHAGLGRAIGEQLRDRIRAQCDRVHGLYRSHVSEAGLAAIGERIRAAAGREFPDYLDEIRGMAEAAGVGFVELLLTGCEESVMNALHERCTTVAVAAEGALLLGHNEDWSPGYEDSLYVVQADLGDGEAFLSLAYVGALAGSSVALNAEGIAFSGNSIIGSSQPGLPKNLILRSQVAARSMDDFIARATLAPRATPNNSMAVDRDGRIVDVELTLDAHAVHDAEGPYLVHTNHVLAAHLAYLDTTERPCSRARHATASELLAACPPSAGLVKQVLRSHERWPHSVCLHAATADYDDSQTVASAIVDLQAMTLSVTRGNPCESEYTTFALRH